MNEILEGIYTSREYKKMDGKVIPIHSETAREQCVFLQNIIKTHQLKSAIEIGMAYGLSSVAIAEAISENKGDFISIDPYENEAWQGVGLDLVKQAGYNLTFYEDYSYNILPRLVEESKKIDFAYIDSTKLFDWIMVDFFYLDKLLRIGGIIAFDDISFPPLRKLARYLSQLPHYEVIGQYPRNRRLSSIRKIMLKPLVPGFLLREDLRVTDYKLGINAHCIALKKTGEDKRNYDWHVRF